MMGEVAVDLSDAKQMKSVANHMSDFIKGLIAKFWGILFSLMIRI